MKARTRWIPKGCAARSASTSSCPSSSVNPFVTQAFTHRTFFSRLHHFMIVSDAFIVTPGGIGSLLELSLAWQLLQVRHLYNTPLILVGKMWADLVEWARKTMLVEGSELASDVDFKIPHCVNTIEEAIAHDPRKPHQLARLPAGEVGVVVGPNLLVRCAPGCGPARQSRSMARQAPSARSPHQLRSRHSCSTAVPDRMDDDHPGPPANAPQDVLPAVPQGRNHPAAPSPWPARQGTSCSGTRCGRGGC